jgi:hypothetical protein
MLRFALVAALLLPGMAHAREWWTVSAQGDQCLSMAVVYGRLVASHAPAFKSPEDLRAILSDVGADVQEKASEHSVEMAWSAAGWTAGAVFFDSLASCQMTVKTMLSAGVRLTPDALGGAYLPPR